MTVMLSGSIALTVVVVVVVVEVEPLDEVSGSVTSAVLVVLVVLVAVVVPFVTWMPITSVRARLFRILVLVQGAVNTISMYFLLTSSSLLVVSTTSTEPDFELNGVTTSPNCALPILSELTKQASLVLVSNDAENDIVVSKVVNANGTPLTLTVSLTSYVGSAGSVDSTATVVVVVVMVVMEEEVSTLVVVLSVADDADPEPDDDEDADPPPKEQISSMSWQQSPVAPHMLSQKQATSLVPA